MRIRANHLASCTRKFHLSNRAIAPNKDPRNTYGPIQLTDNRWFYYVNKIRKGTGDFARDLEGELVHCLDPKSFPLVSRIATCEGMSTGNLSQKARMLQTPSVTQLLQRVVRRRKFGVWERISTPFRPLITATCRLVDGASSRGINMPPTSKGDLEGPTPFDPPHVDIIRRSRGGLTTGIHALVDTDGFSIVLKLTEGPAHDARSAEDVLGGIGNGQILLAGRTYKGDALCPSPPERGAWASIKPMSWRIRTPAICTFPWLQELGRALPQQAWTLPSHGTRLETPLAFSDRARLALLHSETRLTFRNG
jgi:hypothetical protein